MKEIFACKQESGNDISEAEMAEEWKENGYARFGIAGGCAFRLA
jgi:hypothetical protein